MPKRHHNRFARCRRWLASLRTGCRRALRLGRLALGHRRRPVPVEVLIADRPRRRALERELRSALGQLQRALSAPLPSELAVVAQQVIATDRQLAGCYQLGQRPDGCRFALVRLALQVNGRRLSTDELLAALAEQCIGLAMHEAGGPSMLMPIDLEPTQPAEVGRLMALRPDPLTPRPNRTGRGERVA